MEMQERMKLYLFDVDGTLNISDRLPGPIDIRDVIYLKNQGNAVGIMGDWRGVIKVYPEWWKVFCIVAPIEHFTGTPIAPMKANDLIVLKRQMPAVWEIIMVGNRPGVHPGSNDSGAALLAGIRFISETDFANGKR